MLKYIFMGCLFMLSSCAIVKDNEQTFKFTVGYSPFNSKYIYIDSYARENTGLINYITPKNIYYPLYQTNSTNSTIIFKIDQPLITIQCSKEEMNFLNKAYQSAKYLTDVDYLKNFNIILKLTKAHNYHFSHKILKQSNDLPFYLPYRNCSELAKLLGGMLFPILHEAAHVYLFKQKIGLNFSNIENEYWANKLTICAYLKNLPSATISISNQSKLSKAELNYFTRAINKKMSSTEYSSKISAKILTAEIFSQLKNNSKNTTIVKLTPAHHVKLEAWCSVQPEKFSPKKIEQIIKRS